MRNRHLIPKASPIALTSDSAATIRGWHVHATPSNGVVVLLHGIGGSRLSILERSRKLRDSGYLTVLVDLRAHGESAGAEITVGYLERHDVIAAVAFAREQHPNESIGVLGVSLGGASPLDIDALVIESVYPDIDRAVRNRVTQQLGPLAAIPSALLIVQLEPRLGVSRKQLRPIDCLSESTAPSS
jgi:uncharacterized protein